MKVTFTYASASGATVPEILAVGLTVRQPVTDEHPAGTGAVQQSNPMRGTAPTFFGRGLAGWTESFVGWKEHADYWTAKMWARKNVQAMLGRKGTLKYDNETGGSMSLIGCVLESATPINMGRVTAHHYSFKGGIWT